MTPEPARSWVRRHPLAVFFGLAYLFSWSCWIPILVSGGTVRPGVGWPTDLPGLAGPLLAAVVTTAVVDGRAGLAAFWRGVFRWRIGWWWLTVPIVLAAGAIGMLATGAPLSTTDLTEYPGVPAALGAVLTVAVVFVFNGLGEEAGWRGFAARRMLRERSLTETALLIALAWIPWHLPLFFIMATFRGFSPGALVGWSLGLVSGSIVLAWLFRGSRGSVLLVAAWHTSYNFTSATPAASGVPAAVTSTLVMVAAAVILIRERSIRRSVVPAAFRRGSPS